MSNHPIDPTWWQASDGKWYPPSPAPAPPPPRTEGLATASVICAAVGVPLLAIGVGLLLTIAAVPLGMVARGRIRESGGALVGEGTALAGVIIGAVASVLYVLLVIVVVLGINWAFQGPGT